MQSLIIEKLQLHLLQNIFFTVSFMQTITQVNLLYQQKQEDLLCIHFTDGSPSRASNIRFFALWNASI